LRDRCCRLAHAETDLDYSRRFACENSVEIERRRFKRDAEARQQRFAGAPLGRRESTLAQHEAADRPAKNPHAGLGHGTRLQVESPSARSTVALPFGVVYSIVSVSTSFHFAPASIHPGSGVQASSLRMPSRVTRQTAISLLQRVPQTSAVTSRWRSGASCGSVGSSTRRFVVRCTSVKVVVSPTVV